ncbi:MAG: dihydropteroate synthase [Lachnospiraceae bacterium]|nr:dihydropteroate synthase [Lachnospiraceae bacterium]MCI8997013.1 dihydropteroate synthase [Lachnospiraceae bacterium]
MRIGNRDFDVEHKTYVMGILNVTPDSFSDGGKWNQLDAALYHAEDMVREGAAIVDIGGESTRPGHIQITEQEEIERVAPMIEAVKKRMDVPVSVDTYKANVAKAALAAGADLVNDIWGLKYDPRMAQVIAESQAACCLMHNKEKAEYENFYEDMLRETAQCAELAKAAGIAGDRIILDPGVGFGKTYEMNLETIHYMERFHQLGYPLLLGTSRKSVIGLTLDLPADQREEGTLVTTVMAVEKGYAFVRVHDVQANIRAIRMTEAILGR